MPNITTFNTRSGTLNAVEYPMSYRVDIQINDAATWTLYPPDYQYVINMFLTEGLWERNNQTILIREVAPGVRKVRYQRFDLSISPASGEVAIGIETTLEMVKYLRDVRDGTDVE